MQTKINETYHEPDCFHTKYVILVQYCSTQSANLVLFKVDFFLTAVICKNYL